MSQQIYPMSPYIHYIASKNIPILRFLDIKLDSHSDKFSLSIIQHQGGIKQSVKKFEVVQNFAVYQSGRNNFK